jgi:hypothetical protein
MNRARESVIAFAAALALGTLASTASAQVSPCKLLTKDDVKAALGGEWQVWEDMGSEEVCVFQGSPTTIVTLTLYSDPTGAAQILELRKQLAGPSAFPVAGGLGDGAFRLAMSSANSIVFGKDQTVVRLEVATAVTSDIALLERLARTAYERMP